MNDRIFFLNHSPINVYFAKNSDNFVVTEESLYEPSGDGEHLFLKIRKKDLTTWDALQILSEKTGVKLRDFGYAGLKDKDALTIQWISAPFKEEGKFKNFEHPKIKILEFARHKNKLKIGHLKGNKFFIKLKKVSKIDAQKLTSAIEAIDKFGMPNYFGSQRFGKDKNNYEIGLEILEKKRFEKNPKMKNFFISAYQSRIFNLWLSRRVEISKLFNSFDENELLNLFSYQKEDVKKIKKEPIFFKLLPGDVMVHYPYGKAFYCEDVTAESLRFAAKDISPTGMLAGAGAMRSDGIAGDVERDFVGQCESFLDKMTGSRRFAWIFPQDLRGFYKEEEAHYELSFFLPKGSYATVLLEQILHAGLDFEENIDS